MKLVSDTPYTLLTRINVLCITEFFLASRGVFILYTGHVERKRSWYVLHTGSAFCLWNTLCTCNNIDCFIFILLDRQEIWFFFLIHFFTFFYFFHIIIITSVITLATIYSPARRCAITIFPPCIYYIFYYISQQ